MNARITLPSKSLLDPNKATQHIYTHSSCTDLKARFELMRRQQLQKQAVNVAPIRGKKS